MELAKNDHGFVKTRAHMKMLNSLGNHAIYGRHLESQDSEYAWGKQ